MEWYGPAGPGHAAEPVAEASSLRPRRLLREEPASSGARREQVVRRRGDRGGGPRPVPEIGTLPLEGFDALVIDGIVNASAFLVELAGDLLRFFTTGNVRNYALTFTLGVLALVAYVFLR